MNVQIRQKWKRKKNEKILPVGYLTEILLAPTWIWLPIWTDLSGWRESLNICLLFSSRLSFPSYFNPGGGCMIVSNTCFLKSKIINKYEKNWDRSRDLWCSLDDAKCILTGTYQELLFHPCICLDYLTYLLLYIFPNLYT